jgi:hypothetical protein
MTYDIIARARRRTRRRVAAAALAAGLIGTGIAVTLAQVSSGDAVPAARIAAPSAPAAGAAGPDMSAQLPADLLDTDVAGVSLPVSRTAGPRELAGGLARGFSHDRAGAALAAVHIIIRVAPQAGPAVFDATLRDQVVGADAAAMRAQVGQAYQGLIDQASAPYGQRVGKLDATLRGYRLLGYSDTEAHLQVLTEMPQQGSPVRASTEVRMQWTGRDWALVAPTGGTFDSAVALASEQDAAGFLPFTAGG